MEAGFVLIVCFTAVFGIVVGVLGTMTVMNAKKSSNTHGILNVDCSDPADGTYLYLNLSVPIVEIADQKRVTFDVHIIR